MQEKSFVFGLKYEEIVAQIEKLGFKVCEDEWNNNVKKYLSNHLNNVLSLPIMVCLGEAKVKALKEISKDQPFKLYVTDFYLKPTWSDKLIAFEWGKLLHDIYGADYDQEFLSNFKILREELQYEIHILIENYPGSAEKRIPHLKELENIIVAYSDFLNKNKTIET